MSATRILPRLAAVAGAIVVTFAFASPAHAADVEVKLSGLSSSMTAGGRADDFSATLENKGKEAFLQVRRVFVIRLDGLTTDGVSLDRSSQPDFGDLSEEQAGPGEVRFTEPFAVPLPPQGRRDTVTTRYRIKFESGAPNGHATVTFAAFAVGRGENLGTASDTVNVKGGVEPTATPSETPAADASTLAPPAGQPGAGGEVAAANGAPESSIPWIFYVLGTVLVASGGAILWLLFGGPRPALVDPEYAGAVPAAGSYEPAHHYPGHDLQSTAVLPTVRDPYGARHGAGPEQDATRDLHA